MSVTRRKNPIAPKSTVTASSLKCSLITLEQPDRLMYNCDATNRQVLFATRQIVSPSLKCHYHKFSANDADQIFRKCKDL